MKNKKIKIIEITMIAIIILVCSISLLQNETIFGYHSYFITSCDVDNLEENNLILVKETEIEKIEKGDIITYKNEDDEVITSEVKEILKNNNEIVFKTTNSLVTKEKLYGKYKYKFTVFAVIYKIIKSKIGFGICVLLPFITLIIMELLSIYKENLKNVKEKKEEPNIIIETETKEKIQEIIEKKEEQPIKQKRKIEQTIQIPLLEIQKQIKEKESNNNLEDTLVLFNKEDIKEVIKKELSTETVDKKQKNTKKSTKAVDKEINRNKKTTKTVEKQNKE